MSSQTPSGRWLIGGPARCGKTHLAETLWTYDGPVAGFPLEGLFTVYSKRWLYGSRQVREDLVEEYVVRPRYTDADRVKTEKPIQYLRSSPAQLRADMPPELRSPVAIVGWVLDRFARENGRQSWAAFDLHPEFRYTFFRKHIQDVKLAFMVRDPREAVAAALYWRGDPGTGAARDARFKHSLIMYYLATNVARSLARRWPGDVEILDFNALVSGDASECSRVSNCFGISLQFVRDAYRFRPHFSRDGSNRFLLPDGRSARLLTAAELDDIAVLADLDQRGGRHARSGFLRTARFILMLAGISPGLARGAANFTYYPLRTFTRLANSTRRLMLDLRRLQKPFKAENG